MRVLARVYGWIGDGPRGTLFVALGAFAVLTEMAQAGEGWTSIGLGASMNSLYSYGGTTYAPFGTLDESGLRIKLFSKTFRFEYQKKVAPGTSVDINVLGLEAEAVVGWQFTDDKWRIAALAGLVWREHELFPEDPQSGLPGQKLGASASLEGTYAFNETWQLSGDARYVFLFDEAWGQIRPEFVFDSGTRLGLVGSTSHGEEYMIARAGAMIGGLRYTLPFAGDVYFLMEAGYEYNFDSRKHSPFGTFHIGFAY